MFGTIRETKMMCEICDKEIQGYDDRLVVERRTLHKSCWKCAYCGQTLVVGHAAMEHSLLHRYGPVWFCDQHACTPPGEKEAQLKKLGVKEKPPKGKRGAAN